ncbi:hypothetical protein [Novosphingobium sp.]|uniref:hypothetical protein n=1 Tax=Novosphingobium sp. TaxID=1874826 RepID=UPI003567EEEA
MRRTSTSAFALCVALGMILAGCEKATDSATGDAVTGEVMPGSISDAMIDLDTSTATPPMAPVKPVEKTAVQASSADAGPEGEQAAEPDAAPAEKAPVASADTE